MKTVNGLNFGFSAVNAGQRNVVVEPQLIATSTDGSFRITPPVSKVLGIQNGDYAMFLSNVDNIDAAIAGNDDAVVSFCEEQGLEVGSTEAAIAIHKAFDMWALAKGFVELDTKGNQKMCIERLSKKDRINFVKAHFDDMLEAAKEKADADTKAILFDDDTPVEKKYELLTIFVTSREIPKFKGSKCANSAKMSGVGVTLNFTDSNVWKQLKADMGEDATKMNRIFTLDDSELQDIEVFDGYKNITVKALVLGDYKDEKVTRIGSKNED